VARVVGSLGCYDGGCTLGLFKDIQIKKEPGARESSRAPFVVVVCSGSSGGRVWTRRGGSCVLMRQGGRSGSGHVEMVMVVVVA
jgi:hypothetical protein